MVRGKIAKSLRSIYAFVKRYFNDSVIVSAIGFRLMRLMLLRICLIFLLGFIRKIIKKFSKWRIISLASAKAVHLGRKYSSNYRFATMLMYGPTYPHNCHPESVFQAMMDDEETYYFGDIQIRGYYSPWAKKMLEQLGVQLVITEEDEQDLREGVVDFVSISYYMSWTTAPETAAGNMATGGKNPF